MPEWVYVAGFAVNSIALIIVVVKSLWGGGSGMQLQFHTLEKGCSDQVSKLRTDWDVKFDVHTTNLGNVIMNVGNRIHDLELKAMESRALVAETLQLYMRREDYNKATDEFKRDVRDAHDDLKEEMKAGFAEVRDQIDAVSQTIEANRKSHPRT